MSHLESLALKVQHFYLALDKDLASFQSQAKYSCLTGCSKCCQSPYIEATILECLPFAFHVYKASTAEAIYAHLLVHTSSLCFLYQPSNSKTNLGACASYTFRPLVCRLFGFSFSRDKLGTPTLIACKDIKSTFPAALSDVILEVKKQHQVPMAANYYTQLAAIDDNLSSKIYPINKAMSLAIEMVITHFHYTNATE